VGGEPAPVAPDNNGHGTFVASEIVGSGVSSMYTNGTGDIYERTIPGYEYLLNNASDPNYNTMRGPFKGIATGAELECFKVAGATGDTSAYTVERALDYATNSADMNGHIPQIISMSLDSGVPDPFFTSMVESAVDQGIVVVVAAGNDGPSGSVEAPADAPDAISVGSVNRNNTVSFFSAHGPTPDGVAKPDIMGVGEDVIADKPVFNDGPDGYANNFTKYYMVDSGTSMATPEVSAVVALMLQVNPNLKPAQVKELLMQHAWQPPVYSAYGPMYYGAGIVDAYAVLLNMTGGNIPPVPTAPLATIQFDQASYQVNKNAGTLNVNVDAVWGSNVQDGTTVNITYAAESGSGNTPAVPGIDYSLPTGNLTFVKQGSENTLTIPVTILDDHIPGANKNFNLVLSSGNNVEISMPTSTVNIIDTDYPTVKFAINDYTVKNGAGTFNINVQADWTGSVTRDPIQVTLLPTNGTAFYGSDYTVAGQSKNTPVTLTISYPNTMQSVSVAVNNNQSTSDTKYFNLVLSNVANATLGDPSSDTIRITSSGSTDTTPPTTAYSISSAAPSNNGWYNTNATITLSATDNKGGSGVAQVWYSLGNGYSVNVPGNTAKFNVSANGTTTVSYWSVDNEGNAETPHTLTINVDQASPVIYATLNPSSPTGSSGWYLTSPTVTITAVDAISGINSTDYSLDGGAWLPYTVPFTVGNGQHTLMFGTINNASVGANGTLSINVGTQVPVISVNVAITSAAAIGSNGWYSNTNPTVTMTATDTSGTKPSIDYSLDDGSTWKPYSAAFTLGNGIYSLVYGAVDTAGNKYNNTTVTSIKVDTSPPVLGQIQAPLTPTRIGTVVNINDTVSNDPSGLITATWSWGDGTSSSGTINNNINVVNGTHTYSSAGTYMVGLNVTNNVGFKTNTTYNFIVIYNPNGGAVIGIGTFSSATGNFTWKPTKSYTATFGFDSQYVTVKGVTTLQGLTEFVLGSGTDLWFQSVSYDWMVVSGSEAIYQGTGTMVGNGSTQYKFIISTLSTNPNKIRVKIWNATTGVVVYDNEAGAANDALPTQKVSLGGVLIYST
jgi:hypothetical protein